MDFFYIGQSSSFNDVNFTLESKRSESIFINAKDASCLDIKVIKVVQKSKFLIFKSNLTEISKTWIQLLFPSKSKEENETNVKFDFKFPVGAKIVTLPVSYEEPVVQYAFVDDEDDSLQFQSFNSLWETLKENCTYSLSSFDDSDLTESISTKLMTSFALGIILTRF